MKTPKNQRELVFRSDFRSDPAAAAAHVALVRAVFDVRLGHSARPPDPAWVAFAYFGGAGDCVAAVEAAVLATLETGAPASVTAIRLAGVAEAYRGQGLFGDLMVRALAWCDKRSSGATLLYTEDPALYARFGFRPLAQHAFVGAVPPPGPNRRAKLVDMRRAEPLLDRLLPSRAPLSDAFAILHAGDLARANLQDERDLSLAFADDLDALIVHEVDMDTLVVADVIAAKIPSMAQIAGALATGLGRARTLFPPDRLGWHGSPERDETGLMIRGPATPAMRRPFMLPPTMSF